MRRLLASVVILGLITFFLVPSASAKAETFVREYTYKASDADSKLSSRVIAMEQVKRLLLEELGTFLTSRTEVRDFQLTKDEIVSYTAGTVATIIVEERWNGSEYYMKASIKADPDQVAKSIKDIKKDQDSAEELQQLRVQTNDVLKELDRLKTELAELKKTSSVQNKEKIAKVHKAYDQTIADLSAKEIAEKGLALAKEKKYDEAIEQFNMAIKADPKSKAPYGLRGQVYVRMKEYDKAIADFSRILNERPDHAIALKNRGRAYYQNKDYPLAMRDLERASQLDKVNPKLMIDLGRTYHASKRYDDAVRSFSRAIEIDQSFPPAYVFRSFSYHALKMNDKARQDLETAARMGDPKAKEMLEKQSQKRPTAQKNRQPSSSTTVIDKQFIKQILDEGRNQYKGKRYDDSIKSFTRAIELDPSFAPAYVFRAFSYSALKMNEKAKEDLETAVRLGDPKAKELLDKMSGR
jgi:tetratricopeptide (TPR) repeat protein